MVKSSKNHSLSAGEVPEVTAMYTDGACSGNPGPGGWGAIAQLSNGQVHEIGGASRSTTNNRMEIQAAIEILRWFAASPQTKSPILYTDSKYVQDGITKWIKGWKKKNWKTTAGKPVLNQDLWQQLDNITQCVNAQLATPVQWRYVKGHAGNEGNERCDAIARAFSKGDQPALMMVNLWSDKGERSLATATVTDDVKDGIEDIKGAEVDASGQAVLPNLSASEAKERIGDGTVKNPETAVSEKKVNDLNQMLNHIIVRLKIADEIASNGYWVTTQELAHLLDLTPKAIDGKGDRWLWRNWSVLKIPQEGMPALWQLERVD